MKKKSAEAVAVAAAVVVVVEYLIVTIVTRSVTNRYTLCMAPLLRRGAYTGVSSITTPSPLTAVDGGGWWR